MLLSFSPTKTLEDPDAKPNLAPVVELKRFSPKVQIDFGRVKLGSIATAVLTIVNPDAREQTVTIDKVPEGMTLSDTQATVGPDAEVKITANWEPIEGSKAGINFRQSFSLKWNSRGCIKVIVLGSCISNKAVGRTRKKWDHTQAFKVTSRCCWRDFVVFNTSSFTC